ncbi:MAG TPA: hypothetical protein VLM37_09525 [Fibrobacteraceae bacterium]|nr:hypothetical protein [Fibrobacteraceae bacterium]
MDLAERVLQKAKAEHIHPHARAWFVLERLGFALLFVLTLLLGVLAFGLSLEALFPDHMVTPPMRGHMRMPGRGGFVFLQMTLGWLPFLWLFFLVGISGLGYGVFRHFRYGYRVRASHVVSGILFASLVLGLVFFQTHLTWRAHWTLMHNVSPYHALFEGQRRHHWMDVGQGRLAGQVLRVSDSCFQMRDWRGRIWTVRSPNVPAPAESVRIWGFPCDSAFCAERVLPWNSPRRGR